MKCISLCKSFVLFCSKVVFWGLLIFAELDGMVVGVSMRVLNRFGYNRYQKSRLKFKLGLLQIEFFNV